MHGAPIVACWPLPVSLSCSLLTKMANQSLSRKRRREDGRGNDVPKECATFQYSGTTSGSRQLTGTAGGRQGASEVVDGNGRRNESSSRNVCLRKGMVILKHFLSADEQAKLVAHVGRLGELQHGGFYTCHNEKTKQMRMMNLGLRMDGKKHALPIPPEWIDIALRACRLATEADPSIATLRPDICVVNHYTSASRLGWHQDHFSFRDPGLPVISLSLGHPATFQYRVSWKKTAATKSVRLESGDALVFGGRSRDIIHAVPGLDHPAAPAGSRAAASSAGASNSRAAPDAAAGDGTGAGGHPRPCVVPGGGRFNLSFRER